MIPKIILDLQKSKVGPNKEFYKAKDVNPIIAKLMAENKTSKEHIDNLLDMKLDEMDDLEKRSLLYGKIVDEILENINMTMEKYHEKYKVSQYEKLILFGMVYENLKFNYFRESNS